MKLTSEMRSVAMQAKSVEELLELAKEYDYSISREEAEEVFAELNKEGELADEELENVAGGSCYSKDPHGYLIVTAVNKCKLFVDRGATNVDGIKRMGFTENCTDCIHLYKKQGTLTLYCSKRTRYNDPLKK